MKAWSVALTGGCPQHGQVLGADFVLAETRTEALAKAVTTILGSHDACGPVVPQMIFAREVGLELLEAAAAELQPKER